MALNGVIALILCYFTKFVYDVIVKKFMFAISSPDEFLVLYVKTFSTYFIVQRFHIKNRQKNGMHIMKQQIKKCVCDNTSWNLENSPYGKIF